MNGVIVTTTINPPTEALRKFDAMPSWHLVVVGDRKTPGTDYDGFRGTYLSPHDQEKLDKGLSDLIGWNCIQRRSMGMLWAWRQGAEIVATVDDDNDPQDGWGKNLLIDRPTRATVYACEDEVFDPIGATNYPHLWHRGFPLQRLGTRDYSKAARVDVVADVQADFWDGDPDVDAIGRMMHDPMCSFDPTLFPFTSNRPAPFNSQNTFLLRKVLPDYFCFPGIGRMDDIWGAYVAQAHGWKVIFGAPSVVQTRVGHDVTRDAAEELLGYRDSLKLVRALRDDRDAWKQFLPLRAALAFERWRELLN